MKAAPSLSMFKNILNNKKCSMRLHWGLELPALGIENHKPVRWGIVNQNTNRARKILGT